MVKVVNYPKFLLVTTLSAIVFFSFQYVQPDVDESKILELEGQQVRVTHSVDQVFYGRYQGEKDGYLLLNEDGTGEYSYDIQMPVKNCDTGVISFEWGFIIDEFNQIVRFERDYGFSYPVIYKCFGNNCFQGCKKTFLLDFILDRKSDRLEVSSSDDWIKRKNE